jgi:hypothetical protein
MAVTLFMRVTIRTRALEPTAISKIQGWWPGAAYQGFSHPAFFRTADEVGDNSPGSGNSDEYQHQGHYLAGAANALQGVLIHEPATDHMGNGEHDGCSSTAQEGVAQEENGRLNRTRRAGRTGWRIPHPSWCSLLLRQGADAEDHGYLELLGQDQ